MTRPLRILACGHSYVLGINRAILRELAKDTAFDVTVAAPKYFHGDLRPVHIEPEPEGSRLRIVGIGASLTRWIHVFRYNGGELRELIRSGDFDVVHAWEEPYVLGGYQIARALRGNSARFCFRTAQNYVKRYHQPFRHFERTVLARAQGWIAGGQLVFDAMTRKGFPAESGRILTLSVDTSAFRPFDSERRREVQESLGFRGPVIGYLGRFTAAKGIPVLLEAMARIDSSLRWNLLFIGSGPLDRQIREWARVNGVSDRVQIRLLRHDEVPNYLPALDLMVAPSQTAKNWREQFGRMTIEAFASGVPFIGSDSGEIPRVVGNAGLIVGEKDIAGWTRTIETMLADPAMRADYAARGLRRAEVYSSKHIAEQFKLFYMELAARMQ